MVRDSVSYKQLPVNKQYMDYRIKRVVQGVLTFLLATTVAFVLYRMLPGGPVQSLARQKYMRCMQSGSGTCSYEQITNQVANRITIDPNEPIPTAYVDFISDIIIHQDLGQSTIYQQPVFDLLFSAMPWSIMISLFGLALGWSFNLFWGASLAYREGSTFDKAGTIFSLIGNAVPYFVAAIIALSIFGYTLHLFPTGGRYPEEIALSLPIFGTVLNEPNVTPGFNIPFMVGLMWHAALPIFTGFVLGISGLGMRGNAIRVMGSDYIRVARLRGLNPMRIANRYLARNAVLPMYTSFMIGISSIFGSSIITEMIFSYPAVGWYTFQALVSRDYPLLMGSFVFYTGVTVVGITFASLTYGYVDPRARGGDSEAY